MNAKATMVALEANGATREFEISHAERLLRMHNNGGWHLPKDSKYEFVNDGLQCRKDKIATDGK